jgi:hypothetical protein
MQFTSSIIDPHMHGQSLVDVLGCTVYIYLDICFYVQLYSFYPDPLV